MLRGYAAFAPEANAERKMLGMMKIVETDEVYHGEWIGKLRDGYGWNVWPDGTKYEGNSPFNDLIHAQRLLEQ